MDAFPWHTDCSYENPPPRYFVLQVLHPDQYGGGTLSVMNVARLVDRLSPDTRAALAEPEFLVTIPPEFIKDPKQRHIHGSVLSIDKDAGAVMMRFRSDIITPLTDRAGQAFHQVEEALQNGKDCQASTLHLTATDLPEQSVILVDNRQWLHARNEIKDPKRHLRRVRWDAVPFLSQNSPLMNHGRG
jgi:alpha-ketoglutarate-dependent taurine dioxygenase